MARATATAKDCKTELLGIARGFLIFFMLMMVGCGLNLKYFTINKTPTLLIDSITINKKLNETLSEIFLPKEFRFVNGSLVTDNQTFINFQNITVFPTYVSYDLDASRNTKQLWPTDPHCSQYAVKFGSSIPGSWLLSFPRSGNTWTRYLLEAASGIFTGSVYKSQFLKNLGYWGETDPIWRLSTIVTKTHSLEPVVKHPTRPVVLIIRNPARSILSYWNYKNIRDSSKKLTASINKAYYATPGFHLFFREKLHKWWVTNSYALKNSTRLHVVFYEKLRDNPLKEIVGILRFLEVQPDRNRLFCLSRHLDGNAKGAQREDDPYTVREINLLDKATGHINHLLLARGYSPLPDYKLYDT